MEVYRAFQQDDQENTSLLEKHGKLGVKSVGMFWPGSFLLESAQEMMEQATAGNFKIAEVEDAGHYIAEENLRDLVKVCYPSSGVSRREKSIVASLTGYAEKVERPSWKCNHRTGQRHTPMLSPRFFISPNS
ncbi:hypothetical protein BU23DRAFT_566994 [Bimuria novae-zelandiae CBS 107.79]|uniref:Uncharacterized protein n=1 Tax=Bimuria novae-zelandiae CBS 107.79 TaxID=1447943 RepID=A0A6A5VE62_9PLEO|nr:hypothetical protein BU23DRAFT_566994 [Bimuria novae-zelandiae CBS 107.79]